MGGGASKGVQAAHTRVEAVQAFAEPLYHGSEKARRRRRSPPRVDFCGSKGTAVEQDGDAEDQAGSRPVSAVSEKEQEHLSAAEKVRGTALGAGIAVHGLERAHEAHARAEEVGAAELAAGPASPREAAREAARAEARALARRLAAATAETGSVAGGLSELHTDLERRVAEKGARAHNMDYNPTRWP